jgi:DNA-binding CsgD family transcriptional regulator
MRQFKTSVNDGTNQHDKLESVADRMESPKQPCQFKDPRSQVVLNSLSAHIAIVDEKGIIVETNRAWNRFGSETGVEQIHWIGMNYLRICEQATGEGAADAHQVAAGIRSVIKGEVEEFLHDYPCHSPTGRHWFYMRAIKVAEEHPVHVVVSHEEITALKLTEEALKKSKQELEEQKKNLEESNIALKVLLRQRETDKQDLEQRVLRNVKDLVFPFLDKLKIAPMRQKDKVLVNLIETHLNEVVSPLLKQLAHINIILTPQEMQIAALVKDGKSSKEIAEILNISDTTVHFHRKNLRQKFGLTNKNANLRTYLLSLS